MLGGEKAAVAFHGDHEPVSIYVDGQAIHEPAESTKSGASVEFENTYNDSAEVTVFGESAQEMLSGKNLWKFESSYSPTRWMILVPKQDFVLPAGSYVFSADVIDLTDSAPMFLYYEDGTSVRAQINPGTGHNSAPFSLASDATAVYFVANNSGTISNIQLEKGSTATEYEPYCGGIPSPNPDYPQPIESIKSVELVSRNADGSMSATRTIDLQGHELRSLPDGTHDELVVHRDGTVELVQRCDASMFDPSYPVSNDWKLAAPQTIQLPSIDPLPTYYKYTLVDGNGADISASVRVMP